MINIVGLVQKDWANHAYRVYSTLQRSKIVNYRLFTGSVYFKDHKKDLSLNNRQRVQSALDRADIIHVFLSTGYNNATKILGFNYRDDQKIVFTIFASSWWHFSDKHRANIYNKIKNKFPNSTIITATANLQLVGEMLYVPQPFPDQPPPRYVNRNERLLIAHTPGLGVKRKGTELICDILPSKYRNKLHIMGGRKELPKYKHLTWHPRTTNNASLELKKRAHISIDQIYGGAYGYSGVESCMFGVPTLCYVDDISWDRTKAYSDIPVQIINTGPKAEFLVGAIDSLKSDFGAYLKKRQRTYEWAHDVHSYTALCPVYEEVLTNV